MIYEGRIMITILGVLVSGVIWGTLFDFFRWEHRAGLARNIALGIVGAVICWSFAGLLPILPIYRFPVTLTFTFLFPSYFLIAYWMVSRETTPIARHDDKYEAAKEDETVGEHPAA